MSMEYDLNGFLKAPGVLFDVRSPGEYASGRIPGAINLPLFSDAERAVVGTTYKQQGKNAAVQLGLRIVGPKLAELSNQAQEYAKDGSARVHCWRGGMRSSSMAWLLSTVGIKTVVLSGGYKIFRRWSLKVLQEMRSVKVLGGLTGSGKTAILNALKTKGEQVLDLEAIANHSGSSFGMLGKPLQPTNEQFENEIALLWNSFDSNRPVWIEDESRMIGACKVPDALFRLMQIAPLFIVERPIAERLNILINNYGQADRQELIYATTRLTKRLGLMRTKSVIEYIKTGQLKKAIEELLHYYDSAYCYSLQKRKQSRHEILGGLGWSDIEWANKLALDS